MTREDAIYWLEVLKMHSEKKDAQKITEALNMAVDALRKNYAEIVYPTDEYIMVAHEKAIHLVRKDSNVRVIIDRRPQPDCPWK